MGGNLRRHRKSRNMSLDEARDKIHIRTPFQNATCIHCHSTDGPIWNKVVEHASLLPRLRDGSVSCASAGCHGPAHPFSKPHIVAPGLASEGPAK